MAVWCKSVVFLGRDNWGELLQEKNCQDDKHITFVYLRHLITHVSIYNIFLMLHIMSELIMQSTTIQIILCTTEGEKYIIQLNNANTHCTSREHRLWTIKINILKKVINNRNITELEYVLCPSSDIQNAWQDCPCFICHEYWILIRNFFTFPKRYYCGNIDIQCL